MKPRRLPQRAFSLIELMVTIGIIGLLAVLTLPALNSTLAATNLKTSGLTVVEDLTLARQAAQSRNLQVEVRFYKLPGPAEGRDATPSTYRALQVFLIDENGGLRPLTRLNTFKGTVVLSTAAAESGLLADAGQAHEETTPTNEDPPLGGYGRNYRYVAFRFTPGGSTDLSAGKNFVTLVAADGQTAGGGASFYTVQVDRINGSVRSIRP